MRVLHAAMRRLGCATRVLLLCMGCVSSAAAQAPVEPSAASPLTADAPPTENPPAAPLANGAAAALADLAALKAELAATRHQLADLAQRQDAAEAAAASSDDSLVPPEQDVLKIYGFADMGVQRQWVSDASLFAKLLPTNSTSFVIGNVNLYFDAQPVNHWRALVELRFTNAPQGDVESYGGLAGTFKRKSTFSYDPHGTAPNGPMWAGSVVLERAWIEWNEHQAFKLRVGNWFTPFGIWNIDHGSPTLVALALPQFILQRWMPVRQTGLMAHGNMFAGDWELGYALTFSNGRQELSNYNFDDKFGYGGRLYARDENGSVATAFGLSYFTGTTSDEAVNVITASPVTFETQKTWEYDEHVMGADVSVDVAATRIRAEAIVRRQTYTPGHRPPGDPVLAPGSLEPDNWQYSGYVLVANQLPWAGIEPFLWAELQEGPSAVGDGIFVASLGVNVHFNAAVQWKTQFARAVLFNWMYESDNDTSLNNLTAAYSRIVLAF
jgi:hypothetical protein